MKLKTLLAMTAAGFIAVGAASAAPISSSGAADDDCYNQVSARCADLGDWGDARYRKCINDGLDACDDAEKSAVHTFAGSSRFRAILGGRYVATTPSVQAPTGPVVTRPAVPSRYRGVTIMPGYTTGLLEVAPSTPTPSRSSRFATFSSRTVNR